MKGSGRFYGPRVRIGKPERCACGMLFWVYWVHRQTAVHKRAVRRWRREDRARREATT